LLEQNNQGQRTPLHVLFTDYISPQLTKAMIDMGPSACFVKDKRGFLPAHIACSRHCSPEKLDMLIKVNPSALYETTHDGDTLLSLALSTATKSHPNRTLIDALEFLMNTSEQPQPTNQHVLSSHKTTTTTTTMPSCASRGKTRHPARGVKRTKKTKSAAYYRNRASLNHSGRGHKDSMIPPSVSLDLTIDDDTAAAVTPGGGSYHGGSSWHNGQDDLALLTQEKSPCRRPLKKRKTHHDDAPSSFHYQHDASSTANSLMADDRRDDLEEVEHGDDDDPASLLLQLSARVSPHPTTTSMQPPDLMTLSMRDHQEAAEALTNFAQV
jgi:hypothetical protein